MAASEGEDFSSPAAPSTGRFMDLKTRKVQKMNGSENCLGTNLSELGATILGVSKQDEIDLVIYQNGVWIPRNDESK